MRVNPATGFATVDAVIDGERRAMVIDDGGSFSALRLGLANALAARHPNWLRSRGGVGEANLSLGDSDVGAPVIRAPEARLGALILKPFDLVGFGVPGPVGAIATPAFWRYYSDKAGERVDGWIAGNVLKSFRLTLDYPHRMSYWRQEAPLDTGELDQVGLVLSRDGRTVTVAGVARKGRPRRGRGGPARRQADQHRRASGGRPHARPAPPRPAWPAGRDARPRSQPQGRNDGRAGAGDRLLTCRASRSTAPGDGARRLASQRQAPNLQAKVEKVMLAVILGAVLAVAVLLPDTPPGKMIRELLIDGPARKLKTFRRPHWVAVAAAIAMMAVVCRVCEDRRDDDLRWRVAGSGCPGSRSSTSRLTST